MKKRLIISVLVVMLLMLAGCKKAEASDFTITVPMETGITGFWFPDDDTIAGGVSLTVMRLQHAKIEKFSLDLDGTLAKEINENKDTLAGIGVKVNYLVGQTNEAGLVFEPSIGVTLLNNVKAFEDVITGFRVAIYGNIVLYKF